MMVYRKHPWSVAPSSDEVKLILVGDVSVDLVQFLL